jgi:hypothetical protein
MLPRTPSVEYTAEPLLSNFFNLKSITLLCACALKTVANFNEL